MPLRGNGQLEIGENEKTFEETRNPKFNKKQVISPYNSSKYQGRV